MAGRQTGFYLGERLLGTRMKTMLQGGSLLLAFLGQLWLGALAVDYGFAPVSGQVTSPFGWRADPITGGGRFHGGLDIAAASGASVYAPQAGYVVYSGRYGGYGNVVVLDHGNSLYTLYGHNSQLLVKAGDSVYRGQKISLVGSTGRSTGPHLHFEVHYNREYINPVSYLSYLQQSYPALAQASAHGRAKVNVNGQVVAQAASKRIKVVNRAGSAYGGKVVQLVNGSNVEMIEF